MMICLKILIFSTLRSGVFTNIFRGAARRPPRAAEGCAARFSYSGQDFMIGGDQTPGSRIVAKNRKLALTATGTGLFTGNTGLNHWIKSKITEIGTEKFYIEKSIFKCKVNYIIVID